MGSSFILNWEIVHAGETRLSAERRGAAEGPSPGTMTRREMSAAVCRDMLRLEWMV